MAGGLPGGAVVGRKDILDWLDFSVTKAAGKEKVAHQGTFNANPVSAAAGIATLEILSATDACARANAFGDEGAEEDEPVLKRKSGSSGRSTGLLRHVHLHQSGGGRHRAEQLRCGCVCSVDAYQAAKRFRNESGSDGLLVNGVDMNPDHLAYLGDARGGGNGGNGRCVPRHGAGVEAGGGSLTRAQRNHALAGLRRSLARRRNLRRLAVQPLAEMACCPLRAAK